jgi:Flp pilus assembly protein TadB
VSGPDDLRVGDAERTRVTEALHDHFAQGRLTQDELEERLDATLAAKTAGDLRQVTHDLPSGDPVAGPVPRTVPQPGFRRPRMPFFALFLVAFLVVAALTGGPWGALAGVIKVILIAWLVMAVLGVMRLRRLHRRWHRQWGRHGWGPGHPPWGGGPWGYGPPRGHWRR